MGALEAPVALGLTRDQLRGERLLAVRAHHLGCGVGCGELRHSVHRTCPGLLRVGRCDTRPAVRAPESAARRAGSRDGSDRGSARLQVDPQHPAPLSCATQAGFASSRRSRARALRAARRRSLRPLRKCLPSPVEGHRSGRSTRPQASALGRALATPWDQQPPSTVPASRGRGHETARDSSGGGWVPSAQARAVRRGSRAERDRTQKTCAFGATGLARRSPPRRGG